jgi:hypothetical protein
MLLFGDGFEHYGTTPNGGRDAMLSGYWSEVTHDINGNYSVVTTQARTGTHSLKFTPDAGGGPANARFSLGGAPKDTCGIGTGIYFESLPSSNDRVGYQFRDTGNNPLLTICFQSDGSIAARKGGIAGTIIDISDTILQAGTFNHVETKATFDAVAGYVEIRVNGVTKLQIGSLNLGSIGCTQGSFMSFAGVFSPIFYWDDPIAWDDTGTENNDFMGAQRLLTYFGNADTAQADWLPIGAVDGFNCIDDVPPDGDTTYLGSATVGDKSDFTLPTLPPETAEIRGVIVLPMARVDTAGIGNLQVSLVSGVDVAPGNDVPLTPGYTYYRNIFEVDPATGDPWTKAGLEAALLRVEKTL